ncbi:holin protein of PBSX prophage [Shouchella clausii KSM-K16]|uniref:Holin protein of PBSX prophage n=1 Tax=Shouchella clausii (strain KSM-K16) TaxID=66692 RepID=Q5WE60_SHOC1|nr:phage holin [Shouchella clausii]BAD65350.1 holin protein of PBSX prophage [Shouchella clausii KSM-K16]
MMFDAPSITRFIGLIVALLAYFGVNVPEDLTEAVTSLAVAILAVYTAWKNNYISQKGHKQKEVLQEKGLTKGGKQ